MNSPCIEVLSTGFVFFFGFIPLWAEPAGFRTVESEESIVLYHGENDVLTYHKAEVDPPAGVDPVFRRSGFIHPVKTPGGFVITSTHPADHHHHIGLWHAWVNTKHDGKALDFWNLKKKQGRVRYAKTERLISDSTEAGFVVVQEHVKHVGEETKVVLREEFAVNVSEVDGAYEIDYEMRQKNVSDHVLEMPAYRYGGGIAYRGPAAWNATNSRVLSSEGKDRSNGHQTRSRWQAMFGPDDAKGTVALSVLCHPKNHDAPQRMRVWPKNSNNGAVFFNYVPVQEFPWKIPADKTIVLRYRIVVEDREPTPVQLDERWKRWEGDVG